jgi:hypothetical protein
MITFEHVLKEVEWYYTSGILNKAYPSTMIQMLVDPTPISQPVAKSDPALPPTPVSEFYEPPAESVQVGVAVNGSGITAGSIDRYGRIGASLLDMKPRLKALKAFAASGKTASWLAWMEEPIVPRGAEWYTRILTKLDRDPAAAWGVVCWKPFPELFVSGKMPMLTKDLPPHPLDPKRTILYYLRRGWMLLPKSVVDGLPWDSFSEEEFELELGLYLHERGVKLRDAGELIEG